MCAALQTEGAHLSEQTPEVQLGGGQLVLVVVPVMGFEGEGDGGGPSSTREHVVPLHALRAALGLGDQLAVAVGPAALPHETHTQVVLVLLPQLTQGLHADAVLLGQLVHPPLIVTPFRLQDGGGQEGGAPVQIIVLLCVRGVGARVPVPVNILVIQGHPPPGEEVQIQEVPLGAEPAHGGCVQERDWPDMSFRRAAVKQRELVKQGVSAHFGFNVPLHSELTFSHKCKKNKNTV